MERWLLAVCAWRGLTRGRRRTCAGIGAAWTYLFIVRGDAPLVIGGRTISEREKLLGASGASVAVIFFLTSVGSVLFSAVCIGLAGVAAHGAVRVPDDLFLDDVSVRAPRPTSCGMRGCC